MGDLFIKKTNGGSMFSVLEDHRLILNVTFKTTQKNLILIMPTLQH